MMILDILDQVRSIPGAAAKAEFLKKEHTPLFDQVVTDAMDPSITYGVTAKDIGIQPHTPGTGSALWYEDFHKLLGRLAARELTGNAAVEAIKDCLSRQPENVQQLLLRVLDRDLGLGVGWRVYREEVLGIKGAFKVALAQHLEKVKGVDPVDGTWFASRKCDGCVSGDTQVEFEDGRKLPIKDVVENKMQGKIKSYDEATGKIVYASIEDWMHNVEDLHPSQKDWYEIELKDGRKLKITGNDSLFVKGKGWTRVEDLKESDEILVEDEARL